MRTVSTAVILAAFVFVVAARQAQGQQFISAPQYADCGGALGSYSADLNHDGKSDLVVVCFTKISTLLGNGDGTFRAYRQIGAYVRGFALADFNHDGNPDLVVSDGSQFISLFSGDGKGGFTNTGEYATSDHPTTALAANDLNGDGNVDLVAAIGDQNSQGVSVMLGNGDGTFQQPVDNLFNRSAWQLQIADINRDGKLDVLAFVYFSYSKTTIRVLLGNGDGTLQAPIDSLVNSAATAGALGDFNGDGILDLALNYENYDNYATSLQIALGTGDGHFRNAGSSDTGTAPRGVVAADLNGDGNLDLVVSKYGDGAVSILLGKGDATFLPRKDYIAGPGPAAALPGDFNLDGKLDLVIPVTNNVGVLIGNGDGTYYASRKFETGNTAPVSSIATADFNGDGLSDLVTGCYYDSRVSVLLANRKGEFPQGSMYATPPDPIQVAVGDFNNDGNADVVTANGGTPGSVSVLLGNGDGTFQAHVDTALPGNPNWFLNVGDFNQDGNVDLVVPEYTDVVVLLGNGDGTFRTGLTYLISSDVSDVIAGDADGDGKLDLLQTIYYGNRLLSVIRGRGDGSFGPRIDSDYQGSVGLVTLADLNEDGKPDAIVGGGRSNNPVGVMLGNGNGSFRLPIRYQSGNGPGSFAVADFDQDGHLDVGLAGGEGASLLLGNGDGTLQPSQDYPSGNDPFQLVKGDFNGDGYVDLAVVSDDSGFGHTINVLLNVGLKAVR